VKLSLLQLENERQWSFNDCWPSIVVNPSAMWPVWSIYVVLTVFVCETAREYIVVALSMKYVVTVPEDVAGISRTYLPIRASIRLFIDACDPAPLIILTMEDQKSLMLCWHSYWGGSRALESGHVAHQGSQYIEDKLWQTNVNIVRLQVAYLIATICVKPETPNQRLELTGQAKPGQTRQKSAGLFFGRVWNWTDPF